MNEKQSWSLIENSDQLELGDSDAHIGEWRNIKALQLNKRGAAAFIHREFDLESFRMQATVALPGAGFIGLVFGARDSSNYELVYLSPGDHKGIGQIQYDPVMNGSTTWQIYNGPGYLSYTPYRVGDWVKFTIDVQKQSAKVYIGEDTSIPHLLISELQLGMALGKIGVWSYNPGYIRDLTIEEVPSSSEKIHKRNKEDYINEWLVSEPYFSSSEPSELKWTKAFTEENGTLNLNRLYTSEKDKSVQVKSTITLTEEAQSTISFGFSDALRLWINEEEIYQGVWKWDPPEHDGRIRPDQVSIPMIWRAGTNTIRAEITSKEVIFGWGFCFKPGIKG